MGQTTRARGLGYDVALTWQIASSILAEPTRPGQLTTGFIRLFTFKSV